MSQNYLKQHYVKSYKKISFFERATPEVKYYTKYLEWNISHSRDPDITIVSYLKLSKDLANAGQ